MRRIVLLALLGLSLAGCNTIPGLGEDVSDGARRVQGWF